jgi:hypothetical protein
MGVHQPRTLAQHCNTQQFGSVARGGRPQRAHHVLRGGRTRRKAPLGNAHALAGRLAQRKEVCGERI